MYIFPGEGDIIIVGITISLKLSICDVWHSDRVPSQTRRREKETAIGQTPGIQLMELSGSDFKITMLRPFRETQDRLRVSAENWRLEKKNKMEIQGLQRGWGGRGLERVQGELR